MPLLSVSAQGNQADFLCAACGDERSIPKGQWVLDGGGHFTSPPCENVVNGEKCCAQETFLWHDWVYESERRKENVVTDLKGKQRKVKDPNSGEEQIVTVVTSETFMDPEHFGAEQQMLIAEVGQALGISRQRRGNGKHEYPTPPKRPTKERVRERFTGTPARR